MNDQLGDYLEDRELLDTQNMLEEGLWASLKGNPKFAKQAKIAASAKNEEMAENNASTVDESLLTELYEIRDSLIDTFEKVEITSKASNKLGEDINRLGNCIKHLGGPVEEFNSLQHISGLQSPDIIRNAQRVIETTKQCYKIGNIDDMQIGKDGKEVSIKISGQVGDINYLVSGKISGSDWQGNEAIDYVYTPGSGRMSVKAFEGGKWTDKSESFDVYWELEEIDNSKNEEADTGEEKVTEEKIENNSDDIGNDFPIVEK